MTDAQQESRRCPSCGVDWLGEMLCQGCFSLLPSDHRDALIESSGPERADALDAAVQWIDSNTFLEKA